jgi:5'-nucleotidase/UDP-sugar diphosphatase
MGSSAHVTTVCCGWRPGPNIAAAHAACKRDDSAAGEHPSRATSSWRLSRRGASVAGPLNTLALRLSLGLFLAATIGPRPASSGDPASAAVRGGEFEAWLASAFSWSADSASAGAALEQRGMLASGEGDRTRVVTVREALDDCERAAHAANYAIDDAGRRSFRASLLTGLAARDDDRPLSRDDARAMIANLRYPRLRILVTTDFHGFLLPPPRAHGRRRVGGSVALVAWIERLRAENPEGTVLVDAGDWFQGTMISNLQFGRPVVEQMNRLGYSAAAIGNHDFDWGLDTLARRVGEMRFAALGANVFERSSGERPPFMRADTSLMRRGVRVGLLGLCLHSTPTATNPRNVASLRFADDSLTAAAAVPELRRGGASVVVVVGHVPIDGEAHARSGDLARLARGVPGVDAWLGGHCHRRVIDELGGVPVMVAGAHGEVIGVCDFKVDPVAGRVLEHRLALVPVLTDSLPADPAWALRIAEWNSAIAPLADTPIGRAARSLARTGDPSVGDLVSDAMRASAGSDIALINTGGLRTSIASGVITRGAIYELMPFDDTIVTVDLPGARLRDLFEFMLRTGRAPPRSGARLEYDPSLPVLHRVLRLTRTDGREFDDQTRYRIALNQFLAQGGDGFALAGLHAETADTGVPVRDAIEAWVSRASSGGGSVRYSRAGRVRRRTSPR